jgi:hypothetical protein
MRPGALRRISPSCRSCCGSRNQISGIDSSARRLNLDMVVPRAAGVDRRHDSVKAERAVGSSYDVATIPETGVVVFAIVISMPEIDHCSANCAAASRQHEPRKFEVIAFSARLAQIASLRRSRLEKWSLGLADGRLITIMTRRRRPKLLRQASVCAGQFPSGSKYPGVEQKSAASWFR